MKYIHNIILIVCFCIFNFVTAYAVEQHATKKLEVAFQTSVSQSVDSLKTQEVQQKIITELLQKQQDFEIRYYVLAGFTLLLVLVFGLLCFLNKRGDKRLEKIVSLLEKSKLPTDEETKNDCDQQSLDIDEAVVTSILYQLKEFEKERGFLVSKITLHEFAKNMKTNTKYLSKVINTYKLKSFRNYINDLRIQYSIHELEHNANYRKYTVKAMAEEAGFATVNSFSKAFQKKTGETVSSFLTTTNQTH